MDIHVYRLIDLARLLFFRALLLEAERRHDVSSSTSAHDTLQTARTHRRRAARRGRGVRPTGTPLSAHGFDSRQRAVDLRPMPDLCGQRARRGRLFAFDANGELIEAPTPAGDAPSFRGATRSSRGVADFSRGTAGLSRVAVPPLTEIVSSDLLDSPFPERAVRSAKRSAPSGAEDLDASIWAVPSSDLPAPSAAEDMDASMRAVPSSERPMPSAAWDVHAAVRDVLAPAEDLPFAKRAARSSRRAMHAVPFDTLLPERPMPSPAEDLPFAKRAARSSRRAMHAAPFDTLFPERPMPSAVRDRGDSSEARYAALAKRSAQTADRLLRCVSRHRAPGK